MKTSPNIDRFAADSIFFSDALAQGSSTAISHKSIFYSLYPAIHKMRIRKVPREDLTSPLEVMQQAGLQTAAFVGGGQLRPKFGFNKGFDSYDLVTKNQEDPLNALEQQAKSWLRSHGQEPFFLFLHTYQVHSPYNPPEEYREKFAGWYQGDLDVSSKNWRKLHKTDVTEIENQFVRDLYAAEVAYSDYFVGQILEELKALGLFDRTMVIFLSDHGQSLGEHQYWGHNKLYDEQLKIPMLIRIPGFSAERIDAPVETVDVMPTVFSVLGLEPPFRFQGLDLLPLLSGKRNWQNDRLRVSQAGGAVALRNGKQILYLDIPGKRDLDLAKQYEGLGTTWDGRGKPPQGVEDLWKSYESMLKKSTDLRSRFVLSEGTDPTKDPEVYQDLKALGYLN
jgi:arylsulfatase A-like enzyme